MSESIKQPTPRYTIASIASKDATLYVTTQEIMSLGYTQEAIFRAGLDAIKTKEAEKG